MILEKVISPIKDFDIKKDIKNSPIWKNCYHSTDVVPRDVNLWVYYIKFDGLTPVQVTKIEQY